MAERSQLGLFSGAADIEKVSCHPRDSDDLFLEEALDPKLHFGASSWNFSGWRGILAELRRESEYLRLSEFQVASPKSVSVTVFVSEPVPFLCL